MSYEDESTVRNEYTHNEETFQLANATLLKCPQTIPELVITEIYYCSLLGTLSLCPILMANCASSPKKF